MQSTALESLKTLAGDSIKKVAICAAHPDDEVIGASSVLMSLHEQVFIFYITDGAPNLIKNGYDSRHYAEIRRREAQQILSFCGIPRQNAFWLNLPDQRSAYELRRLTTEIRRLVSEIKPDVIVAPAYEGGHPDHDSTALATAIACAEDSSPRRLEMLSYHNQNGCMECDKFLVPPRAVPERHVILNLEECSRKRILFAIYVSQQEVLRNFPVGEERFRVAPDYDFLQPPHAGTLYYDLFPWGITASRWRERARMFLQNSAELFR